jgi:hypothetical protein
MIEMGEYVVGDVETLNSAIDTLTYGSDEHVAQIEVQLRLHALKVMGVRLHEEMILAPGSIDPYETRTFAWVAVRVSELQQASMQASRDQISSVGSDGSDEERHLI